MNEEQKIIERLWKSRTMSQYASSADLFADMNSDRHEAAVTLQRVVAERDSLRQDAERYRWLRASVCSAVLHGAFDTVSVTRKSAPGDLDAAIDAAKTGAEVEG